MDCRYYQRLSDGRVECQLCPHRCKIANGKAGICRSRSNVDGVLVSKVYGKPCSLAIDPIEKKPLYHFHPGTKCLSIACAGCNFRCLNCQNHEISQASPTDVGHYDLSPRQVVALCIEHHCPGIAYTYTEPLKDLLPYLDAANIDLKSFSDDIYQRISGGHLQPVLDTILAMRDARVWIELTNLVIPGVNDDMEMIRQMCRWIADNGLADNPLHFSRFFPRYKLQHIPPTPVSTLQEAKGIAERGGINYVYLGNV